MIYFKVRRSYSARQSVVVTTHLERLSMKKWGLLCNSFLSKSGYHCCQFRSIIKKKSTLLFNETFLESFLENCEARQKTLTLYTAVMGMSDAISCFFPTFVVSFPSSPSLSPFLLAKTFFCLMRVRRERRTSNSGCLHCFSRKRTVGISEIFSLRYPT